MNNTSKLAAGLTSTSSGQLLLPEGDLSGKTLGDFRLLRRLGQGGMGQVYLAEQTSLRRPVALKILKSELAFDSTSLKRFKAEAEAVARATHANIVQVYAFGETSGLYYMAMEYVEGLNLREYLEKKGPPPLSLAVSIMRQVAAALQRAGELGIIHRDIKPENILLTRKGLVKVADFGLSRCFNSGQSANGLTHPGVTMGTPLYMSPEQVEGKELDPRTDIYSFGVTCFQMLAGDPPFQGRSPFEIALRHVQTEPVELGKLRPDLPLTLCAVVHKMMAKQPDGRYQTGRELLKDLNRVRESLTVKDTGGPTLPVAMQVPADGSRRLPGWVQRPLLRAALASVVLALVAGAVVGWSWKRAPAPHAESTLTSAANSTVDVGTNGKLHEQFLLAAVQEYERPQDQNQVALGIGHSLELGLFYLHERRLDDAERLFQKLISNPAGVRIYVTLGRLGHAIVLAFQDKADESNEVFLSAIKEPDQLMGRLRFVLNRNPRFLQMMAKALDHNAANCEAAHRELPPALQELRKAQPMFISPLARGRAPERPGSASSGPNPSPR
jgi:eukaryotic-like serine/threonine-protein kinase